MKNTDNMNSQNTGIVVASILAYILDYKVIWNNDGLSFNDGREYTSANPILLREEIYFVSRT